MEVEDESLVGAPVNDTAPAEGEELEGIDPGPVASPLGASARVSVELYQQHGTDEENEQQDEAVHEKDAEAARILARARKKWPAWRVSCLVASHSRFWQLLTLVASWTNALLVMYTASLPREEALELHPVTDVFEMCFFVEFLIAALGYFGGWWNDWVLCMDAVVAFSCLVGSVLRYCAEVDYGQHYLFVSSLTLLKVWRTYRCFEPRTGLQETCCGIDVLAWCEDLGKSRPINVLVSGIRESKLYVLYSSIYVGTVFVAFAVLCTGFLGKLDAHDHPSLQEVLEENVSTVPRALLTLFEAAHGGFRWRSLIFPFLQTEDSGWKPVGFALLGTLCFFKFSLWNLVFGVYVRDAVTVARKFDEEVARQEISDSDDKGYNLREIFEEVDMDQDGCISRDELLLQERKDPTIYDIFGGDPESVQLVHAALDYDRSGLIPIDELIFGIVRIKGSSKSSDMLHIDYKQKALLHRIEEIKRSTSIESTRLNAVLSSTEAEVQDLQEGVRQSLTRVNRSTQLLEREIAKLDQTLERHRQKLEKNAALDAARKDVELAEELQATRSVVESRVGRLNDEVNELALAAKLEAIHAAGPETVNALRLAVRRRLEAQLQPWLEEELALRQAEPTAS